MSSVCCRTGHALRERAAARVDHVLERRDAERPRREIALHEQQVAIVLQAFLELVRREQVIQVARLRRVRQRSAAASTSRPCRPCRSRRSHRAAGRCESLRWIDRCAATPDRTLSPRTCTDRPPAWSRPAARTHRERPGTIPAPLRRACSGRAARATARAPSCSASRRSPPSRRRAVPCSIAGLPAARVAEPSSLRRRDRPSATRSRARDWPCHAAPPALRSACRSARLRRAASPLRPGVPSAPARRRC